MPKIRIILTVLIPAFIIFGILLAFYYTFEMRSGNADTTNRLEKLTVELRDVFATNLNEVSRQIDVFASLLNTNEETQLGPFLEKTVEEFPYINILAVAYDPQFLVRLQKGEFPDYKKENLLHLCSGKAIPDRFAAIFYRGKDGKSQQTNDSSYLYDTKDWYLGPKLANKGEWSNSFADHLMDNILIVYGVPFYYKDTFVGVIAGGASVEALFKRKENNDLQNNMSIRGINYFILTGNGRVIYHSSNPAGTQYSLYSHVASFGNDESHFELIDSLLNQSTGTIKLTADDSKETHLKLDRNATWYTHTPIWNDTGWILVGEIDERSVLAETHRRIFKIGLFSFIQTVVLCFVILLLFLWTNRPVLEMSRVAREISLGNLNEKVPKRYEKRAGPIGGMVVTFNNMIDNLHQNIDRVVEESANRAKLERELLIAQNLQKTFMPSGTINTSDLNEFHIEAKLLPAKFVAGDFFDFWYLDDDTIALLIADVSGKGVPAAMVMIAARTMIRQIAQPNLSPGQVLTRANEQMIASNDNAMFITIFFGYYSISTGVLQYTNAGHNPPYLIPARESIHDLGYADNPVLGIVPDIVYSTDSLSLEDGDLLFLYTDGVTDAISASDVQFGTERLEKLLEFLRDTPVDRFLPSIIDTLEHYRGNIQADDITAMVLKRMM